MKREKTRRFLWCKNGSGRLVDCYNGPGKWHSLEFFIYFQITDCRQDEYIDFIVLGDNEVVRCVNGTSERYKRMMVYT